MLKYTFIFITSHNTTCPTELGRHFALRFSFGMLHRALELTVFVQREDPEVLTTAARGTATPPTSRVQWTRQQGSVTVTECPATRWPRTKYCTVVTVNLSLQKRLWQWIIPSVLVLVVHTVQSGGVKTFCFILMSLSVHLSVSVTVHFHCFVIVKWGQSKL